MSRHLQSLFYSCQWVDSLTPKPQPFLLPPASVGGWVVRLCRPYFIFFPTFFLLPPCAAKYWSTSCVQRIWQNQMTQTGWPYLSRFQHQTGALAREPGTLWEKCTWGWSSIVWPARAHSIAAEVKEEQ
jgi:hypothetical protein